MRVREQTAGHLQCALVIESIGYTEEPSKEDGAEFKENANVLFNILGTWYRESDSLEVTVAQFSVWNEHKTESAQTSYMSGALKTNKTKWVYLYTCRNYTLYITDRNGDVIELKRIIK